MGFTRIQKMPDAEAIRKEVPLPAAVEKIKAQRDAELQAVFAGEDARFVVIVGPCSADDEDTMCEYARRLAQTAEKVKDRLFIIPRVYTNKPRTTGEGYKGMMHQPDPTKNPDMADGIRAIRAMHIRVMQETGLTAADEMLYPDNLAYCEDLLSYIAVGARSVENQQHRLVCSGVNIPVGMKNPTSGDVRVMFNAIQAAQGDHMFFYGGYEVQTSGNPLTHAIMRGSVNRHGEDLPNYHYEDLQRAVEMYTQRGLVNPFIVVDTNHSNSAKRFAEQPRIAKDIMYSRRHDASLRRVVRGLMIESYLEEGSQPVGGPVKGKSITDPCLGWEATERLLLEIAEEV